MSKLDGVTGMNLIHEALSRARMRRPQAGDMRSEATRSARRVAMEARHTADRMMRGW
jgi:hypothetical protein